MCTRWHLFSQHSRQEAGEGQQTTTGAPDFCQGASATPNWPGPKTLALEYYILLLGTWLFLTKLDKEERENGSY